MATTRDAAQTTTPKSLLIRGDRLMLALDVLELARTMGGRTPASGNTRGLSIYQILAVVGRIRLRGYSQFADGEIMRNTSVEPRAERFLRKNAPTISDITLDVMPLLEQPDDLHWWNMHVAVPLFRAIASGDLTEADFKEGEKET